MSFTLCAQPLKVPKLELLPEKKTTSKKTTIDISKCMAEIQCFDQDVEEATAQVLTKFISKSELGEIGSLVNEICTHRINVAIEKRDDMWRQHETAQISFLQNENSQMLTGLHAEIERLHHRLRDLYRRLYVKNSFDNNTTLENENELLRKRQLQKTEQNMDKLNQELQKCEKKSRDLEQKTSGTIRMLKNQLAYQGNRIRQLTDELSERTAQITKLMAQLPFGTVAEITGNEVPARIHFYSQPTIPWNPAPASFFGKKDNNFSHASLIRNVSITYPGGRPNVVARKYNYTPTTPRSHHLPSLYSKPRSAPLFGHNIEKPTQLQMLELRDRMSFTRSLYEIRNPFTANSITSKNSKASISVDESTQNTI
uniref:CCDC92 domain-containing protein n=1 Tax=Wuchereria bancrofti TaxID=6293 RepID=A0AAF5RUL2_WUCBA